MLSKLSSSEELLTFDDVLIEPAFCGVRPESLDVSVSLTERITLSVPFFSAAMDTVTEAPMAIAMAQMGGLGVLHYNLSARAQAEQVEAVKRFEATMVSDPVVIAPDRPLREAMELMKRHHISGLPVVDGARKLIGIITNRDVRFCRDRSAPVSEFMTHENLVTVHRSVTEAEAKALLHTHRIEKLIVVDEQHHCVGLITAKDLEKSRENPKACKDEAGHLRVAAAISPDEKDWPRASLLTEAGVDIIVIDTAHGHSATVPPTIKRIKEMRDGPVVVAGNIVTKEAARFLIEAGADVLKVGIGPGASCITRERAGVGVPQLSALMQVLEEADKKNIPVIADGGVRTSGDVVKAMAVGARAVMMGRLFAGTNESPGKVVHSSNGCSYKIYRGMGSLEAMVHGSAERYGQNSRTAVGKLIPEGVQGQVPYKGSVFDVVTQLEGGLRAALRYTGSKNPQEMRTRAKFIRISRASLIEGGVHDMEVTGDVNYFT